MVNFLLIRHGESEWNRAGRYQGQIDTALSSLGVLQAQKVSGKLSEYPVDRVVTSPLRRARTTVSPFAESHPVTFLSDQRVIEINHGEWQGKFAKDIEREYPTLFLKWKTLPYTVQMPGGEHFVDVFKRVTLFITDVSSFDGTLAVCTHDAVLRMMLLILLRLPVTSFWDLSVSNASVTFLAGEKGGYRTRVLNDVTHLSDLVSDVSIQAL